MTYANMILDPSVSDEQLAQQATKELAERWKSETREGRAFAKHYASRSENINKLAEVFSLLDEEVSFETLSGAFNKLVANGAIRTEQEIREAAERAERERHETNQRKWEVDCSRYVETHSTTDIKARAQSDRAFRAYLKAANQLPELPVEYSEQNIIRQRRELKAQREKDKPFLNVEQSVRDFAAQYQKMPFAEVQKQMRDPQFRLRVEQAAAAHLI